MGLRPSCWPQDSWPWSRSFYHNYIRQTLTAMELNSQPTKWYNQLWWKFIPGVVVDVSWPKSDTLNPDIQYRPWLEKHIGKQGWDWQWYAYAEELSAGVIEIRIQLKFRKKYSKYATMATLMWN